MYLILCPGLTVMSHLHSVVVSQRPSAVPEVSPNVSPPESNDHLTVPVYLNVDRNHLESTV